MFSVFFTVSECRIRSLNRKGRGTYGRFRGMVREPKWMVVAVGIPRRQTEDHKVRNQHQKHLSLRENARCRSLTEGGGIECVRSVCGRGLSR